MIISRETREPWCLPMLWPNWFTRLNRIFWILDIGYILVHQVEEKRKANIKQQVPNVIIIINIFFVVF